MRTQGQPLVPWCLPNTADRHNGWRGLFGRLDYGGHFPTSVTDPQPMGKVTRPHHMLCFTSAHPRITEARCALMWAVLVVTADISPTMYCML